MSTQNACKKSPLNPKPFVYTYAYLFFDQFRIITRDLMMNFALCLVAITLICAVVIVHPRDHNNTQGYLLSTTIDYFTKQFDN